MTRARSGKIANNRHKKVLKLAKGYRGRAKNCFRIAVQKVEKALSYAYRDRRNKKRELRRLWIQRINAAARENGIVYSQLMDGIKKLGADINRKMLAELAVNNPAAFDEIATQAKKKLAS